MIESLGEMFVMPGQIGENVPGAFLSDALRMAVLEDATERLRHLARPEGGAELSDLVSLLAWIEDGSGDRARGAGAPYPVTLEDSVHAMLGNQDLTAEAVTRQLRVRFAEWRA